MVKELRCRDLAINCDIVISGETEAEVLAKATEHALAGHGLEVDAELLEQVRAAIRTV